MTYSTKVHDSNKRSSLSPHVAFTNPARRPGFLGQVKLLLWKSLLHQRRSIWFTLAEICIPLLGAIILLIVRELMKVTVVSTPTIFKPLNLSSSLAAGNLTRPDTRILYAPNTFLVNDLMKEVGDSLVQDGVKARVMGFASEQILETHYLSDSIRARNYSFAVIFMNVDGTTTAWPTKLIYKLRPRSEEEDQWFTHRIFPVTGSLASQSDDKQLYYSRGFLYAQLIVNKALIRQLARNDSLKSYLWQINGMPIPPFIDDGVIHVLQQYFPVIIMLSFILSVIVMSKNIVVEKEKQLKESMKLMGLSTSAYWAAWFLQFLTFLLVACVVYTILLSIRIGKSSAILAYSNPAVVFLFFLSYSISVITFCFFMSTMFTKANIAASVSGIVFFAAFFPQVLLRVQYDNMRLAGKLAVSLLFNTAMSLGAHYITLYEGSGQGVQWSSFTESPSIDDNFTLKHAVVMLVADAVIFAILAWYLENVHPGDYGVPRPWFFPFQLSYWCDVKERKRSSLDLKTDHKCARNFEFDPPNLAIGIRIVNLSKMREGSIMALRNVTLSIHEGQITALLGHSGAGKTTIMSVLTGFIRPTSGTAVVNGYDICTDIDQVRNYLGLCPQHDVLFDYLTVDEHLAFFAMLKGCPKSEIEPLIKEMASDIGLESTRNTLSRSLSRVQKRKLSIAIALIGGSKVVLLDEPTLGMDPAARHQVWRVLQRYRVGRTILMCTDSMDEADILGDRIAIIAEGVIKCCGTSMFLKKRYGAGYNLVIIKEQTCNGDAIIHTVQSMIKSAVLESDVGPEMTFLLPEDKTADFPSLFNMLETRRKRLGISSFDVTATTMEEVFLKVGASGYLDAEARRQSVNVTISSESSSNVKSFPHNDSRNLMDSDESSSTNPSGMQSGSNLNINQSAENLNFTPRSKCEGVRSIMALNEDFEHLSSVKLHMSRFYGIIVKKAIHTFRNRIFSTLQFLLPVICTIAALTIYKVQEQESVDPCLPLQLDMFGDDTISAVGTSLNPSVLEQELASSYIKLFEGAGIVQTIPRMQYETVNDYYLGQAAKLGRFIYNTKVIIGADFQSTADNKTIIATAWYSTHLYHTRPIALAYLTNAVLQKETRSTLRSIGTINHPMPKTTEGIVQDTISENLRKAFPIGFVIMFGMSFLTASFSYFLIRERKTGSKHLQVVSGVGPLTFWLANFAWDLINYFIPCLAMLVIFAVFKVDAYTENGNLTFVLLLLVSFGFAVLPYTYILQTTFTRPATGFVVLLSQAFVSGLFTMLIVFVLRVPSLELEDMAFLLDWLFMVLFPHYAFGVSLSYIHIKKMGMNLCREGIFNREYCALLQKTDSRHPCCPEICGRTCLANGKNYLAWDYPGVGRNVFVMSLQSVVFFALIVIIEYQLPKKLIYICKRLHPTALRHARSIDLDPCTAKMTGDRTNEDSDVAEERMRVMSEDTKDDVVVLRDMYKHDGALVTVDHLCVGMLEQECFGLLGQKGAGKTTTLQMLTGEVTLSGGDALICGHSIIHHVKEVQAKLGYCPQFDALIEQMTGRETLTMYARLKGVPAEHIERIVKNLLDIFLLRRHADKFIYYYSVGNKRKLSTAIALIGNPPVLLLDEPTTGMDPGSRRQLWNVLSKVRASGKTVVLTSNSVEECEALCTRIAIMVNGHIKCLGSPDHLQSKFGHGYTLMIKMATLDPGIFASSQPVIDFIIKKFPGSLKFDAHEGFVHFQVPSSRVLLSTLFSYMETAKQNLNVQEYSVHQTTLEQVFLAFTRTQNPQRELMNWSTSFTPCQCLR